MMERCAFWALFMLASPAASAACLDIGGSSSVELHGLLTYKIFPGPPNFEDVRKGDTPEPSYIVKLDKSVCTNGGSFSDPAAKIDSVQVYVAAEGKKAARLYDDLAHLRDKKVVVRVTSLDVATTGHHHAPLIAALRSIAADADEDLGPPPSQAVVKAFYEAVSVGAGDEAVRFVVPAKRRSGPLSAGALSRSYGGLETRLQLQGIESKSLNEHLVRYRYKAPGQSVCEGRALVTTTVHRGAAYIASIQTLDGC